MVVERPNLGHQTLGHSLSHYSRRLAWDWGDTMDRESPIAGEKYESIIDRDIAEQESTSQLLMSGVSRDCVWKKS